MPKQWGFIKECYKNTMADKNNKFVFKKANMHGKLVLGCFTLGDSQHSLPHNKKR